MVARRNKLPTVRRLLLLLLWWCAVCLVGIWQRVYHLWELSIALATPLEDEIPRRYTDCQKCESADDDPGYSAAAQAFGARR